MVAFLDMVSLQDRVALLLAIKEEGKRVDLGHVFEKVSRDIAFVEKRRVTQRDVEAVLEGLIFKGLAVKSEDGYAATPTLDGLVEPLIRERMEELNRSYALVWLAKKYYPQVAEHMIPFLKDRPVSAVKIFSGKKDPIRGLETIFVRYARYKPKPIYLTVDSADRLMTLVFDHCIDFIPYIHRLEAREPDVFVLDLDAGSRILEKPQSFDFIRCIAGELSNLLLEIDVEHMLKFSGSRGFQIWASFDNTHLRKEGDVFRVYREMAIELQRRLEKRLQDKLNEVESRFPGMVEKGKAVTTSIVAHKEERAAQILVDWSVLKPMGDVRAPFSIHYKTGLASLPIPRGELEEFTPKEAHPLKVVEKVERYVKAAQVRISNPLKLISK